MPIVLFIALGGTLFIALGGTLDISMDIGACDSSWFLFLLCAQPSPPPPSSWEVETLKPLNNSFYCPPPYPLNIFLLSVSMLLTAEHLL